MARANRLAPRRAQRGVAAIFAAVALVTLLSAVGLAIDIGRLYYTNRDLQRLADLAAIDGARVHSQCLGSATFDAVVAEVEASLKRNKMVEGVKTTTRLGIRRIDENGLQVFQAVAAGVAADSVQVTLSRSSPARILPLFSGSQSRILSTRAAARGQWVASASVGPPRDTDGTGNFKPTYIDRALGLSEDSGGGRSGSTNTASISVADLFNVNGEVSTALPDMQVPTPVAGLLTQIAALLDQSGDGAAAAAVSSYAAAIAAARPGSTVVPANVFGLPAQGTYDGASTTVGDVLSAVAGAVSNGDPIALGGICDIVELDKLPTAQILPAFCDSSITLRVPQPSRSGVFNSNSSTASSTDSSSDTAASAGGLAEVQVGFVNPIDGQPLVLPIRAVAEESEAVVTALSCGRMGQPLNVATVVAKGPRVTFAIGNAGLFTQSFSPGGGDGTGALDDAAPVVLINLTVRQLLTATGAAGSVLANPLSAGFLDQPVIISVRAGPVVVGSNRSEELCMQGPPYGRAEQCDGAPATIGGTSSEEAAQRVADGLSDVDVIVSTPEGLPLVLDTAVTAATDALKQTLADSLRPAVRMAASQLVPVLQSANLVVGESYVYLDSAKVNQPGVYAQ